MPRAKEIVDSIFDENEKARLEKESNAELARQFAEIEQQEEELKKSENFIRLRKFIDKTCVKQQMIELGETYLKGKTKVEFEEKTLSCGKSENDYYYGEVVGTIYTLFHKHQMVSCNLVYVHTRLQVERGFLPIFNTTKKVTDEYPILFVGLITNTNGKVDLMVSSGELGYWGEQSCLEEGHGKYKQKSKSGFSYFENVTTARPSEKRLVKAIAQSFYEGCNTVFKEDAPNIFRNGKNSSL